MGIRIKRVGVLGAGVMGATVGNLLMLQPLWLAEAFGVRAYARIFSLSNAIAVIGVAAVLYFSQWPPAEEEVTGAIGAAERYRAEQITSSLRATGMQVRAEFAEDADQHIFRINHVVKTRLAKAGMAASHIHPNRLTVAAVF